MGSLQKLLTLLALCAVLFMPASAQAPRRVALVIANSAYANTSPLANPANDARLVADSLRRAGFQTVDVRENLSHAGFRAALRDLRMRADGAEVALVYYAGHGIEGNGRNWLLPVDAALLSERDLEDEAFSLDRVMEEVRGAKFRVVVLDACRNNPFGRSWNRGTRAVTRGLAPVESTPDNLLVLYAAAPGQVASDGAGANSPFATALARRLPEPGAALQLLGGKIRDDVLSATGNEQQPWYGGSMTGTEFYLVPAVAIAPPRVAAPAPAADPALIELAVWQGALAANTVAAFEDYLRQYPAGRFVVQAQQNVARLRSPAPTPTTAQPPQARRTPPVGAATVLDPAQAEWLMGRWRTASGRGFSLVSSCWRYIEFVRKTDTQIELRSFNETSRAGIVGGLREASADHVMIYFDQPLEFEFNKDYHFRREGDVLHAHFGRDDMKCDYIRPPPG